jgi:hypothetical protein
MPLLVGQSDDDRSARPGRIQIRRVVSGFEVDSRDAGGFRSALSVAAPFVWRTRSASCSRFYTPLIEADMQMFRIRLSN